MVSVAKPDYMPKTEKELAEVVASFYADPLGFVMFAYPWGEPLLPDGSANPLKDRTGPEPWQRKLLTELGAHIRTNIERETVGMEPLVWKSARASGHGVGKSALVVWVIHFLMATRPDTRGVVTANTAAQLASKTWPELAKWHKFFICSHWFKWEATKYYFAKYPDEQQKNYMVEAATVSEQNTEAFAGLHNAGKSLFVIFDEASGIIPKLWEVAQGAFTDAECFFLVFGNPTQPTGEFADCFGKNAEFYNLGRVDSREVSHTNKTHIMQLIKQYGEDSDEIKIRIRGEFPSQAYNGFISVDTVIEAKARELVIDPGASLIMAVDVARYGDDEIVIGWRQGRDARSRKQLTFKNLSIVRTADVIMDCCSRETPDAIVIEGTGVGAGVIDILRARNYKVVEVSPGAKEPTMAHETNCRARLWRECRDWLVAGGCIYDDPILSEQLVGVQYGYDDVGRTRMENKEDYKKRTGKGSPDRADNLVLTFGAKVARRDTNLTLRRSRDDKRNITISEYDPLDY